MHTVALTVAYINTGTRTLDAAHIADIWAGECDSCMIFLYEDEVLRNRWVTMKKKIGEDSASGSGDASKFIRPPELSTVEWNFWLTSEDEDEAEFYLGVDEE